jgi:hypothetical protein
MARKRRSDCNQVIYKITNKLTGDTYIGRTFARGRAFEKSIKIRFDGHMHDAFVSKCDTKFKQHLRQYAEVLPETEKWSQHKERYRRSMRKIFQKQVLEIVRGDKEASRREAELINTLRPPLNTKMKAV